MLDVERIHDLIPPANVKATQLLYELEDQEVQVTISINGKMDIVVADEGSLRLLFELVDRLELFEALKQATKELDEGKGLSLEEVKDQARKNYGISL